ncbi:hypothetical protein Rcae01_03067 [Novipirellula caenicola]|uniref:Uncharacterized protein n=1 Tax=Novipirellula caenicola TaxID=1536901 RepID=A0ABP9VSM2_9BACT
MDTTAGNEVAGVLFNLDLLAMGVVRMMVRKRKRVQKRNLPKNQLNVGGAGSEHSSQYPRYRFTTFQFGL